MTVNEFLRKHRPKAGESVYPYIVCADGLVLSVQASSFSYSNPQADRMREYSAVEVMPVSRARIRSLRKWYNGGVYANVPVSKVDALIAYHGGIANG